MKGPGRFRVWRRGGFFFTSHQHAASPARERTPSPAFRSGPPAWPPPPPLSAPRVSTPRVSTPRVSARVARVARRARARTRRAARAILRAHPEARALAGPDWRSKYLCVLLCVLPQLALARAAPALPWPAYLAVAYAVGATLTQALFLAIHELTHNLFFASPARNRAFAILVNLPVGLPFCAAFRGYHLEHHAHQGVEGVDTDLPSALERRLVRGPLAKAAWASLQIVAYALRPVLVRPQRPTAHHAANWAAQLAFDVLLVRAWGWGALRYLWLCVLLAGGLHPCAGHFLSEHYVFPRRAGAAAKAGAAAGEAPPQETFSYYGPLNALTWNVGYHNEHHDFPTVPWSRLPALTRLAPEFYDDLATCDSWTGAIWAYVARPEMGPHRRVTRPR